MDTMTYSHVAIHDPEKKKIVSFNTCAHIYIYIPISLASFFSVGFSIHVARPCVSRLPLFVDTAFHTN